MVCISCFMLCFILIFLIKKVFFIILIVYFLIFLNCIRLFDIASSCDDDDDNCRCENAAALIECGGIQCPVNNYDEICPDDCPVCGECLDIECDRVSPQPSAVPSISDLPSVVPSSCGNFDISSCSSYSNRW